MNLRTLKALAVAAPLLVAAAACTDPTVAPKSTVTGANIWNDPSAYAQYMARLYGGLVVTGQVGPNGNPDIAYIDEGTSEYLRLNWYLQELPTDEAVIGWNDPGVPNLVRWQWGPVNPSGTISNAMYYRIYFQVVLANEFLRQTTAAALAGRNLPSTLLPQIQQYRAEARFLRALAYWNGIDLFGSIPLVTEADPIGGAPPMQTTRDSLYRYVVRELKAIQDSLPSGTGPTVYGRATPMADHMLLAELYLNAGVYTGTADYANAQTEAAAVIAGPYTLEPVFRDNFAADNNTSTEVIFAAIQNGTHTQTWGGMTFLVHAGCGGTMQASWYGMDYCWGGYRLKQQAYGQFIAGDARGAFIYDSLSAVDTTRAERSRDSISIGADTAYDPPQKNTACPGDNGCTAKWTSIDSTMSNTVSDIGNFERGAAGPKFTNKTSTGGPASQTTMIDTNFPIFRLGEAFLIYAEAAVRTGNNVGLGVTYFNQLRERAFGNATHDVTAATMTLDTLLAERTRELLFEARRRTDLIRYGQFAGPTATYLWAWKGGDVNGIQMTDPKWNLYPIPSNELIANPNLKQNPGYTQ